MSGNETIVGINYANNEAGEQDFTSYQSKLENLAEELRNLKKNSLEEWTGEDEVAYQQVMAFHDKESAKMSANMASLSKWTNVSGVSHKACEKKNANNIINALSALQ